MQTDKRKGGGGETIKKEQQQQQQQQKKTSPTVQRKKGTPSIWRAMFGMIPGLALLTSTLATIIRCFAGFSVCKPLGKRPEKTLRLYDMEGDPNCRLVREALTVLDLEAVILPCPKGGKMFRYEAAKVGGKEKFPLLVDENTDRKLYGAKHIVPYLFRNYGGGARIPFAMWHPLVGLSSFFASLVRGFAGVRKRKGIQEHGFEDLTTIELWSYEASPHCRLVREVLTELEIPYLLHNVGKRSPSRKKFVQLSGKMMVPYLLDKSKEKEGMFEHRDIIDYLERTYGY